MYNPDDDYRRMLQKLKEICSIKGVSQYALAQRAGMSCSSVSCLMRGETQPYIGTLLMICNALGIALSDLLDEPERSADEEYVITAYRGLQPEKKKQLTVVLDMLLKYEIGGGTAGVVRHFGVIGVLATSFERGLYYGKY